MSKNYNDFLIVMESRNKDCELSQDDVSSLINVIYALITERDSHYDAMVERDDAREIIKKQDKLIEEIKTEKFLFIWNAAIEAAATWHDDEFKRLCEIPMSNGHRQYATEVRTLKKNQTK